MARAKDFPQGGKPPWMIIFADLMTLLLTFFVILVSMSVIDEQSHVRVAESVHSVFGLQEKLFNYDSPFDNQSVVSGVQSTRSDDRGQKARQLVFADNQHLTLRQTESSIIIEVDSDVLFQPGSGTITDIGREALDRLVPFFLNMRFPAVIAGHSATGYSEGVHTVLSEERLVDSTWGLSMDRALAVYHHFLSRNVDKQLLKLESFGSHRPEYDNASAEGRRRNRRVDLTLDKRNPGLAPGLNGRGSQDGQNGGSYIFRDFEFDLNLTPPQERGGRR